MTAALCILPDGSSLFHITQTQGHTQGLLPSSATEELLQNGILFFLCHLTLAVLSLVTEVARAYGILSCCIGKHIANIHKNSVGEGTFYHVVHHLR